jgi:hypothetical protein
MAKPPLRGEPHGEIYLEFHVIGHMVKVSAIDSKTLTEVSIVGSARESKEVLKTTAIRKLHYVMEKKKNS